MARGATLAHCQRRFAADNLGELGERAPVVDLIVAIVGAREKKRPHLAPIDRAFWVVPARVWSRWSETLTIVKPETVISWHR